MVLKTAIDPRGWSLRRESRPVIALVIVVCAAALLTVLPLPDSEPGSVARFLALASAATAGSLICLRMERARRFLQAGAVPNLTATWTFAGALILPHLLAVTLVAVVYGVHWFTQQSQYAGKVHRYLFGAASVVIGVRVAGFAPDPIASGALFLLVNLALVAAAIAASGNFQALRRMADPREQGTEILTLALGFVTAQLVQWHLVLGFLSVPLIVVLQYLSLSRHIRQPSTFDAETGVLTNRAWHALGALRLAQSSEAIVFQVLVSDTGDGMRDCAAILRGSVREEDLIGRNPDGFSVLVAAAGGTLLSEMLALQIQARFAAGGIETYVGSATTPDHGSRIELQDLAVAASAEVIVQASDVGV